MHSKFEYCCLRWQLGMTATQTAAVLQRPVDQIIAWDTSADIPPLDVISILGDIARARYVRGTMQKPAFRFIDLFAGIGGMRLGFEAAGGECVFTCEWDEKAQETYRANFGAEHAIHGDITKLDVASIPQHDVLVAGFPCQPFSIAGVSKRMP